jgi:hypothetical protein
MKSFQMLKHVVHIVIRALHRLGITRSCICVTQVIAPLALDIRVDSDVE